MWIAKGMLLGVWAFSFGTLAYFALFLGYRFQPNSAIDIRSVTHFTVSNSSWWLWLVACLSLGMVAARSWPGRGVIGTVVWTGLALTELLPLGLLAVILVLVNRMRTFTGTETATEREHEMGDCVAAAFAPVAFGQVVFIGGKKLKAESHRQVLDVCPVAGGAEIG